MDLVAVAVRRKGGGGSPVLVTEQGERDGDDGGTGALYHHSACAFSPLLSLPAS